MQTPTLISWSFRVEQEITANTVLRVGYVGSHGYHEIIGIDANEPFPVICPASPCPAVYPATFPPASRARPFPLEPTMFPRPPSRMPRSTTPGPIFRKATALTTRCRSTSITASAAALSLRGVYTWSKTLDDGDSVNATTSGNEPALASNPFNLRADKGLANFDVRNAAAINGVYELPFGHGKPFLANATGFGDALASGWSINSILTLQSGFPFTPQLSYNPSNTGDTRNPVRPFVNPAFTGPVIIGSPNQWFNPAAFLAPPNASGFYGNLGRDTLTGPGLATWDVSFLKDTRIQRAVESCSFALSSSIS